MLESISTVQLLLTIERIQAQVSARRGSWSNWHVATLVWCSLGRLWLMRRREPFLQRQEPE